MTYYLYHIPGKKIGVTRNLEERVHKQQGYKEGEYVILAESKDITEISTLEIQMQKAFGYKVDRQLYKNLKCNKKEMKINVTEQTTTFPMPLNKLKGRLMDNIGMTWETTDGDVTITSESKSGLLQTQRHLCITTNDAMYTTKHLLDGLITTAHTQELEPCRQQV